jgi:uncharacterized membrane protein
MGFYSVLILILNSLFCNIKHLYERKSLRSTGVNIADVSILYFKMYHLATGFYKLLTKKDEYNVLILGLDDAGKSTFLETAKTKFSRNYKGMNLKLITTTVGLNIGDIEIAGVKLSFWDLGGQKELQSLWDKVFIFVSIFYIRFTIHSVLVLR